MAKTDKVGKHMTSKGRNDQGQTTVTYWDTDVVSWDHKVIILDTGGWGSATTKLRMNQASQEFGLGYRVWQKDFNWYVDYEGETLEFNDRTLELTRFKGGTPKYRSILYNPRVPGGNILSYHRTLTKE